MNEYESKLDQALAEYRSKLFGGGDLFTGFNSPAKAADPSLCARNELNLGQMSDDELARELNKLNDFLREEEQLYTRDTYFYNLLSAAAMRIQWLSGNYTNEPLRVPGSMDKLKHTDSPITDSEVNILEHEQFQESGELSLESQSDRLLAAVLTNQRATHMITDMLSGLFVEFEVEPMDGLMVLAHKIHETVNGISLGDCYRGFDMDHSLKGPTTYILGRTIQERCDNLQKFVNMVKEMQNGQQSGK
jgi:hypothetical protein